jgi:hypothetical protein
MSTPLTDAEIVKLREKLNGIAPPPWSACSDPPAFAIAASSGYRVVCSANQNNNRRFGPSETWAGTDETHAKAIAAVMNATPAMLATIDALRSDAEHGEYPLVERVGVSGEDRSRLALGGPRDEGGGMRRLKLEDGTTWPDPLSAQAIAWRLRYAQPGRGDLVAAADVIGAYGHLITHCVGTEAAVTKLRMLRRAAREAEE